MKVNKYPVLLCIALLLISYFLVPYTYIWASLDEYLFIKLNSLLSLGKGPQMLCALLNHKLNDWIIDIVYLTFFTIYIRQNDGKARSLKVIESFLIALSIFAAIFVINKIIFRDIIPVSSLSPSLKVANFHNLNQLVPFLRTKYFSYSSFPGDHATTALLFFFLTWPLFSKKAGKFLLAYTLVILLPRLVVGAHNISDILVGSLAISFLISMFLHHNQFLEKTAQKVFDKLQPLLSKNKTLPL